VLRALEVGNKPYELGCEIKEELPQRLDRDGVRYQPEDLSLALVNLEDSGCLVRFQRQMQPQRITGNGSKYYDDIDRLAADIAGVIKAHDEEFGSEDQVRGWLDETGIAYDDRAFVMALRQLEELGRVRGPGRTTGVMICRCRVSGFRQGFTRCMEERELPRRNRPSEFTNLDGRGCNDRGAPTRPAPPSFVA
jgi:hypothetical protein